MIVKTPFASAITNRKSRYAAVLATYPDAFSGSVLDLGCDVKHLAKMAYPTHSVGVALSADADIVHNLEITPYPFSDREFDTVVCLDVLEHLEAIHAATDEIFRIAARTVILTLPNPIDHILAAYLFRRRYRKEQWTKFHSLTLTPPEDRHRWFYSEDELDAFLLDAAKRHNFVPKRCRYHRLGWKSHLMGVVFGLLAGSDSFGKWTLAYEFERL